MIIYIYISPIPPFFREVNETAIELVVWGSLVWIFGIPENERLNFHATRNKGTQTTRPQNHQALPLVDKSIHVFFTYIYLRTYRLFELQTAKCSINIPPKFNIAPEK